MRMLQAGKPLKVLHLIPGAIANHSPTLGIAAQIKHHDRERIISEVVSFYPAPNGRSPASLFAELGVRYSVLTSRRDRLDSRAIVPLVRHLRRTRPDVVQCHFVRANIYGRVAARMTGTPVVVNTLRGIDDYLSDATLRAWVVRLAERTTLHLVSRYVAVSDAVRRSAREALDMPEQQIVTILNAVDLDPFQGQPVDRAETRRSLAMESDTVLLASVGNLIPLKNHQCAIRMVHQLRQRTRRDVRLLIVGEGPDHAMLECLINQLGLGHSVHLLGLRRDVPRLLRAADVFVMFSLAEGLPRAAMEAMAAGLPCVTSDRGGIPEAMIDGLTGFVRPLENETAIYNALEEVVVNAGQRAFFGAEARRIAFSKFSPARLADEYEALYRTLIAEGNARGRVRSRSAEVR
jgi:glycosyltransferase involved in cell wall biosynthesis